MALISSGAVGAKCWSLIGTECDRNRWRMNEDLYEDYDGN